jgi:uncharacterized Zn finger protein
MDTGKGEFVMLEANAANRKELQKALEEQYPQHGGWFHVGEILEIHGSFFRVKSVKPHEIRLKLLSRE